MQLPRVGYVTARPGARLHLDVLGRAHCGAGTGKLRAVSQDLAADHVDGVCRRCRSRIRALVQEALAEAMRRREGAAARIRNVCNTILDLLRTDAQVATEAAAADTIRQRIHAGRNPRPLSGLGALRAAHAAAADADRAQLRLPLTV